MALVAAVVAAIAFTPIAKTVVGRWKITYPKHVPCYIDFHGDGTFFARITATENVGGTYKFSQNTLKVSDTSCNAAYWGTYKLTFHGADSIYSEAIEDSCAPRKSSADKVFLVRQH